MKYNPNIRILSAKDLHKTPKPRRHRKTVSPLMRNILLRLKQRPCTVFDMDGLADADVIRSHIFYLRELGYNITTDYFVYPGRQGRTAVWTLVSTPTEFME